MEQHSAREDEIALVCQARQGNATAFDLLAECYRSILLSKVRTWIDDANEAEDLVQETLQRAWQRMDSLHHAEAFTSWLHTILLNTLRMHFRRNRGQERPVSLLEERLADDTDPAELALTRGKWSEWLHALAQLPHENRQALLLYAVEKYSYKEIAGQLHVPLSTVEGRIQRARQQLRRLLGIADRTMAAEEQHLSDVIWQPLPFAADIAAQLGHLRNGTVKERAAAAAYLGHVRAHDAVETLIAALDDQEDATVCLNVIFALGRIRDPRAIEPLRAMMIRREQQFGDAAREALTRFPPEQLGEGLYGMVGFPRGGFDTAQERWKESISLPAYSTTGLTLPDSSITPRNLSAGQEYLPTDSLVGGAAGQAATAMGDTSAIAALLTALIELALSNRPVDSGSAVSGSLLIDALRGFRPQTHLAMLAEIKSGQASERRLAVIELLQYFPGHGLEKELVRLLPEQNHEMQVAIVTALGIQPQGEEFDLLKPLLPWGKFRFGLLHRPMVAPERSAVEWLVQFLLDPDAEMRRAAAKALLLHGDRRAVIPLMRLIDGELHPQVRRHAVSALGAIGDPRALPVLKRALQEADGEIRLAALNALALLHDDSGLPLVMQALLDDPSPEVRTRATMVLCIRNEMSAVDPLCTSLRNDPNDVVREYAAMALGMLRDARAVPALIANLRDPVEWTRTAAALALGRIGDRSAVEALVQAIAEPEEAFLYGMRSRFRTRCCGSLIALGDPRGIPPLREIIKCPDSKTYQMVGEELANCRDPRAADLLYELSDDWMTINGDRQAGNIDAMIALCEMGDPRAIDMLMAVLYHTDGKQPLIMRALANANATRLIPRLRAALEAQLSSPAGMADALTTAELLWHLNDTTGLASLLPAVAGSHMQLRYRALLTLAKVIPDEPGEVSEILVKELASWDPITRVLAARALCSRDDNRALPPLATIYKKSRRTLPHVLAAVVLGDIDRPAMQKALRAARLIPVLLDVMAEQDIDEQVFALAILAASRDPRALAALESALRHPASRLREAAITGIARFGDR